MGERFLHSIKQRGFTFPPPERAYACLGLAEGLLARDTAAPGATTRPTTPSSTTQPVATVAE